jgi:hypothetical protein
LWCVFLCGQATIKLYVLTAMFEILDKLMISFGQDTLDSLYWSAKKNTSTRCVIVIIIIIIIIVNMLCILIILVIILCRAVEERS